MPFLTSPPPLLISYTHLNLGNMHENVQMFCDCFLWLVINTTFIPTWKIPTKSFNQFLQKKICVQKHIDLTCFEMPNCIENEKVVQYFDIIPSTHFGIGLFFWIASCKLSKNLPNCSSYLLHSSLVSPRKCNQLWTF